MDDIDLTVKTDLPPESTLVIAFPEASMAALSATQHVIATLDLDEVGHVSADGLPAITPYSEGRPYHHTRLFSAPEVGVTVLTSELPVPIQFSESFGRLLVQWLDDQPIEEITVLTSIPFLNAEELFYVASEDYADRHFEGDLATPLQGGFLTGVNASLIARAIDCPLRVGVLATAGNPQVPVDGEAALRLVEGLDALYEVEVDTAQLEAFAAESSQYYQQLTEQFETAQRQERRSPEDYGYM